ncbi:MAG TPA: NlpC/P60 family protein [bacterium]|nr:NlpC/P60 family protein [bacterium]HQL62446.1 NlpC/P60 family protein [bacterium]
MVNQSSYMDADSRRVSAPDTQQIRRLLVPEGEPHLEHLPEYLRRYRARYVFDPRVMLFEVRSRIEDETAVLEGFVANPGLKEGLVAALESLGISVRVDRLSIPPTDGKRFGIVEAEQSFQRKTADADSEHVNELLRNESVILMGPKESDSILVQAMDGYLGWIPQGAIRQMEKQGWRRLRADIGPTDRAQTAQLREEIVAAARERLGAPYLWAGRSERGLDCSGLVRRVYAKVGIHLPRDADQQSLCGKISGDTGWREDLEPGDLLFFAGKMGNITHVALSLGGLDFIHAKGSQTVQEGSLSLQSTNYEDRLNRMFFIARRVLG